MNNNALPIALFRLGRIVATPYALKNISNEYIRRGIQRHEAGDWGELDEHDRQENELSLKEGFRLLSVYHAQNGVRFSLLTEADRSVTTVLLPQVTREEVDT